MKERIVKGNACYLRALEIVKREGTVAKYRRVGYCSTPKALADWESHVIRHPEVRDISDSDTFTLTDLKN